MRFFHIYVIVLLTLSANEVLSDFCDNKTLSNGTQIRGGSCSKTIQGDIPSVKQMTSTFITSPKNEAVLEANQPFSVDILISHLETGHFSDPEKEYYTQPQSLNRNGVIEGHTHVTIQEFNDNPFPPDAENFVFFNGVNKKAERGHLSVDVVRKDGTPGLPAGRFRICTMAGSLSHQPLLMPVAKRGAQDDCIRIAVNGKGKGAGKGKGKGAGKGKGKDAGKGKGKDVGKGKGKDVGKGKGKDVGKGKGKDVGKGKGKDVGKGKGKDVGKGKGGAKINKGKKGRRL